MFFEKISVIGLGYIGLPTAAMFASRKLKVVGVDVNQNAVDTINKGKIHIVEPGLEEMVQEAVAKGFLSATNQPETADAFLIAVPTPFLKQESEIPEPDLTYIQSACMAIASVLEPGNLVILESTSPVGATEQMAKWLATARQDLTFPQDLGEESDIRIAHCPERVLPGKVVTELVENDRVIGGMTQKCSALATELYRVFVKGECVTTNARTAEMAKLTENSCRDVQIAFANELSMICHQLSIDVWELIDLANRHPRINILQPGPGVGGHCIAVDPWFIISKTPDLARLIHTARDVNDRKPYWVIDKVKSALSESLLQNPNKPAAELKVACLGLAFKPDIDDLRESPAVMVTAKLAEQLPCKVIAVEPNIEGELPESLNGKVELLGFEVAISEADLLVLLVDHKEFRDYEWDGRVPLIDTKGIWK